MASSISDYLSAYPPDDLTPITRARVNVIGPAQIPSKIIKVFLELTAAEISELTNCRFICQTTHTDPNFSARANCCERYDGEIAMPSGHFLK